MAVVGTVTSVIDNNTRHWRVSISGVTSTNQSPNFNGKGYQVGTAITTGTITTGTLQWWGSNDNVNFVKIGTAISVSPSVTMLASPDNGVYAFYFLDATALTSGGPIAATVDFVSQNAS